MTFKERLKIEHPKSVSSEFGGGCHGCPYDYGYEPKDESFKNCKNLCSDCWNREIPVDDFKVGDKVRLRRGLVVGKVYDGLILYNTMLFSGERKVTSKNVLGNYCLNTRYNYSPVMLEKVKAEETESKESEKRKMTERKFKVGDKVRTTKLMDSSGNKLFPVGTCGKIIEISEKKYHEFPYKVEADGNAWWYSEDMLEKIEFTTDDLKDGNLLKDRQGNIYVWLSKYPRRILECLSETQKDFKNSYSRSYDIVEVRDSSGYRCGGIESLMKNYDNFPIIWKEKETKELSLKELKSILVEKYPNIDEFRIPQISDLVI